MRIGTLFSGIGAPEQGAMRVYDIQHAFACEWDKFARQSFLANYAIDEAHFHKDIYDMDGTQYKGKVDVLVGGSPCQAFSIAGLRKGLNDKRGELIYEYIRIVDEVKAPIIVYENVKGMLSIDKGRTIKEFVQALRDIGYHCHYSVINSKDYGVPQNRERLFLVGFLDVEHYHAFSFAPKMKLTKRLRDVLESEVDEKYYLSHKIIEWFKKHKERHLERGNGFGFYPKDKDAIASCLQTKEGSRASDNYINEGVIGMLDIKGNESIRRVYGVDGNAPCLQTMQGGNREPKILDLTNDFNEGNIREYADFSPTLRSERFGLAVQEPCKHLTDDYRIRKLTPRECLRLQDFPDTFKQVVSDSQMYKQAGNSMTVAVLEMIFRQIEKALNGKCENLFGETA